MPEGKRIRADELVVLLGLAPSRSRAKVLIIAGDILTPEGRVTKPAELLARDTALTLREKPRYVGRGGIKLQAAIEAFHLDVTGVTAADIGASTGGFTDCLLQHGASRVYAIDVGYGQLDFSLREDARVVVKERCNARYLERLEEPVDLVVIDVSFISLKLILPAASQLLNPDGAVVALVKPQFEAGRGAVSRQGVVRDEQVRERVVREIIGFAGTLGLGFSGVIRSPLTGPAGNDEFLVYLVSGSGLGRVEVDRQMATVFAN